MTELFVRIYRFFSSHKAVCWLSMLSLFLFFGYFATRIHLEEDIDKLMPSSRNEDGSLKLAFASLKIKDKTFLTFEGTSTEQLTEACDAFVDTILARDSVTHAIGDVFYRLPEDLMADGIGYLTDHLPAYIDTAAYAAFDTLLTREHLTRQMAEPRGHRGRVRQHVPRTDTAGPHRHAHRACPADGAADEHRQLPYH